MKYSTLTLLVALLSTVSYANMDIAKDNSTNSRQGANGGVTSSNDNTTTNGGSTGSSNSTTDGIKITFHSASVRGDL